MTRFFLTITVVILGQSLHAQLFTLLPKEKTGIGFTNTLVETKHYNIFNYEYIYNGAGVSIGDINNDGLNDIFFTGNMSPNKLYLNKGNLQFEDISLIAGIDKGKGINTGTSMMDINGDGWLDIYVCKSALRDASLRDHNVYINNHDNTFTEKSQELGLGDSSYSTQAYFFDFDKDGDLDLYLLNHPEKIGEASKLVLTYNEKNELVPAKPKQYHFFTDRYFENVKGKFVDKTQAAGILNYSFGLSASIADFNHDGYFDIYIANDYSHPDFVYINNRNGTFSNKSDSFFSHFSFNSMGSDIADINNDGLDDVIVLDMLPEENYRQKQFRHQVNYHQYEKYLKYGFKAQFVKNVVQIGVKNKKFIEISHALGMTNTDWSWAPLIADFDNNGHKDVYITNGYYHDITDQDFVKFKMDSFYKLVGAGISNEKLQELINELPSVKIDNYFYSNQGNLKFSNETKNAGLGVPSYSNGAAYGDLDNDGDLDLVVNNLNQESFVFRNNTVESKQGNFIRIKLVSKKSPNSVYGTKIIISTKDSNIQHYTYYPVRGYLSSHEHAINIGIGKNTEAEVFIYKNGGEYEFAKKANTISEINMDELLYARSALVKDNSLTYTFEDITKSTKINHVAEENEYTDTKQEPLIPRKFSRNGPAMAVGDINGDRLEDIFLGGAMGFEACFYIQNANGEFRKKTSTALSNDRKYEDGEAQFLDVDQDGDQDLIVTSGGADYAYQMKNYPVRCYLNHGKEEFSRADSIMFPNIYTSSKTIAIEDYDRDGDPDLFIGGQVIPGHYGRKPGSYFLKNEKGRFKIDEFSLKNEFLSMINDAKWIDLDNDSYKELLYVGDWSAPMIIKNNKGVLENNFQSLGNYRGWWQSITLSDFNHDGANDILLGNYGINSRYNGSNSQPMTMIVHDYDKNGSTDAFLSMYNNGVSYPLAIRDNIVDQMPFLRKRFNRYQKYSHATTSDVFTAEEMKGADTNFVNWMSSAILYSKNNGGFDMKKLPFEAQMFPINTAIPIDINQDGFQDIILAGNDYNIDLESGRIDAGQGLILENTKSSYKEKIWKINESNNLDLSGDVKRILPITIAGKLAYIVGRNNEVIQLIQIKNNK